MQKMLSCITTCGTVVNCLWYAATWSVKINNSNYAWGEGGNQESPILFYTSQQEHTQRPGGNGRDEGCMCDSEERRASAVLMPPRPPIQLPLLLSGQQRRSPTTPITTLVSPLLMQFHPSITGPSWNMIIWGAGMVQFIYWDAVMC